MPVFKFIVHKTKVVFSISVFLSFILLPVQYLLYLKMNWAGLEPDRRVDAETTSQVSKSGSIICGCCGTEMASECQMHRHHRSCSL